MFEIKSTDRLLSRATNSVAHACALSLVVVIAISSGPSAVIAQTVAPEATAPVKAPAKNKVAKAKPKADAATPEDTNAAKDPATAQRNYSSGVIAFQAGKFDTTIQSMNAAMQTGALPPSLLANALYYRGAAFQKQGKPGQAISDLTSALWLKGGLTDADRADAVKARAQAYQDAGLTDQGSVPGGSQAATPSGTGSLGSGASSGLTETPSARGSSAAPVMSAAPMDTPPSSSGGISDLFSNMFGSSKPSQPAPPPTPAPQAAAAQSVASPTNGTPEVLPWSGQTTAAQPSPDATSPATAPRATPAPKVPATKVVAVPKAATGKYRIQVAAVKSRDEASEVISKIQSQGGILAATPSAVDETTFGTMGTFYRVRLGPFANAQAAKAPCDQLKAQGFDCLVTAK
jgi:cell division septation protein DedD